MRQRQDPPDTSDLARFQTNLDAARMVRRAGQDVAHNTFGMGSALLIGLHHHSHAQAATDLAPLRAAGLSRVCGIPRFGAPDYDRFLGACAAQPLSCLTAERIHHQQVASFYQDRSSQSLTQARADRLELCTRNADDPDNDLGFCGVELLTHDEPSQRSPRGALGTRLWRARRCRHASQGGECLVLQAGVARHPPIMKRWAGRGKSSTQQRFPLPSARPEGYGRLMSAPNYRATGDIQRAEKLLASLDVQNAIDAWKRAPQQDVRRQLLARAVRLTPSMTPGLAATITRTAERLGLGKTVEPYVVPDPSMNAFASLGRERVLVVLTSSLLQSMDDDELAFVVGHELGHVACGHLDIPVHALAAGTGNLPADRALQLYAWARYAEVSADRAGLIATTGLDAAARALFKVASGLATPVASLDLEAYLSQIGDVEAERNVYERDRADNPDWFATHPFSPLRLRAVQLFAGSDAFVAGGMSADALESELELVLSIMDPGYLDDRTEVGEAMRRVLFSGGVLVAAATDGITDEERKALERFLGEGSLPFRVNEDAIRQALPERIERFVAIVPLGKRAQVIRDLCVLALADGHADDAETAIIRDIAERSGVDGSLVDSTLAAAGKALD